METSFACTTSYRGNRASNPKIFHPFIYIIIQLTYRLTAFQVVHSWQIGSVKLEAQTIHETDPIQYYRELWTDDEFAQDYEFLVLLQASVALKALYLSPRYVLDLNATTFYRQNCRFSQRNLYRTVWPSEYVGIS